MSFSLIFGLSFITSAAFTYVVIKTANKLNWGIDDNRGVPRLGGLAIIVAVIIVSVLKLDLTRDALITLAAGSFVAAVGLLDDMGFGRGPLLKLGFSLAVASITLTLTDVYVANIDTPIVSQLFEYQPLAVIVSIVALAGMCHGINLIDGLHGLALSFSVIAFGALTVIAQSVGEPKIAGLALCLVSACLGLMAFNFPSGSIFMGDVGSYFLGFVLAWISIYICHRHPEVSPWAMLNIFAYPVVDVGYSATRRVLNGVSPIRGDRKHLHHNLLLIAKELIHLNERTAVIMSTLVCATLAAIPAVVASNNYSQASFLMTLTAVSLATLITINILGAATAYKIRNVAF